MVNLKGTWFESWLSHQLFWLVYLELFSLL